MIRYHATDIFRTREGKPLHRPKLGVRMEISDDLQTVKTRKDRVDLFVAAVIRSHALVFPGGGLETESMFYDKPVFQLVSEQKTKTLPLINFC